MPSGVRTNDDPRGQRVGRGRAPFHKSYSSPQLIVGHRVAAASRCASAPARNRRSSTRRTAAVGTQRRRLAASRLHGGARQRPASRAASPSSAAMRVTTACRSARRAADSPPIGGRVGPALRPTSVIASLITTGNDPHAHAARNGAKMFDRRRASSILPALQRVVESHHGGAGTRWRPVRSSLVAPCSIIASAMVSRPENSKAGRGAVNRYSIDCVRSPPESFMPDDVVGTAMQRASVAGSTFTLVRGGLL